MEQRTRSPNYPAISLPGAIDKLTRLYGEIHNHPAPREVVAKGMGYNSLNGASATAISALSKYGLLDRAGSDLRVSERGMSILHPQSGQERMDAIKAAAAEPKLFTELSERFHGEAPNDELLRNHLVRRGFAPSALGTVILAYRETIGLVEAAASGYDSGGSKPVSQDGGPSMASPEFSQIIPGNAPDFQANERSLGRYDFEGGGHVRILASGEVDTEEALSMVDTLVELKRKELGARKDTDISPSKEIIAVEEINDDLSE